MSLGYAQEKAYKILHSLGSSEGILRERIFAAIVPSLISLADECDRHTSGLHENLEAEIVALYVVRLNNQRAAGDEGTIDATLTSFDAAELEEVAERMVSLCIEVMQQQGDGAFMLGAGRGEDPDLF
ncbi:MAG TPA: hypothetical protein VG346_08705 [Acidimicrobiales bacterium]|jgi:hypothetical protein|nr:hypothetical protein [Acidimicrobiales bacterium]